MAYELDIIAFKHAPWGGPTGDGDIVIWNEDWSDATFLWQFGSASDLSAEISLGNAAAGQQGVSTSYDSAYRHPSTGKKGAATLIRPQIDESTLEGLTFNDADDLVMRHTLYVTPSGGQRRVLVDGTFTIKQGVADA